MTAKHEGREEAWECTPQLLFYTAVGEKPRKSHPSGKDSPVPVFGIAWGFIKTLPIGVTLVKGSGPC